MEVELFQRACGTIMILLTGDETFWTVGYLLRG